MKGCCPLGTIKIQNLLLPNGDAFDDCHGLFYNLGPTHLGRAKTPFKGPINFSVEKRLHDEEGLVLDEKGGFLSIGKGLTVSFCTYFNSCSVRKWLDLTHLDSISLRLRIKGSFEVVLRGFYADDIPDIEHLGKCVVTSKEIARSSHESDGVSDIEIAIPDLTCTNVGFEIIAHSDCTFVLGSYLGNLPVGIERNAVELGLATTTFKKEDFITRNIGLIKRDILDGDEEIASHFHMYVVDNGQSLDPAVSTDERIRIIPNRNVGGAGGFSRGMIEALRSETKITNLLIMDDDVLILSESIIRLYVLLTLLRPEYQSRYVSGAMLCFEVMNEQHEDIGFVHTSGYFESKKGRRDLEDIRCFVADEVGWPDFGNEYAAWWFCCIPMSYISEKTLPMPLFVRGDDVEFSLRNAPGFISLNGICVWHVGFNQKYSASMELYQVLRNSLILQAASGVCQDTDFYQRAKYMFMEQIYQFAYDYADLVLDAVEDFLKGPSFLEKVDGGKLMGEKGKLNEKLVPLSEYADLDVDIDLDDDESLFSVYKDEKRSKAQQAMCHFTRNGHEHAPKSYFKRDIALAPYDWAITPGRQQGAHSILAVDPYHKKGILRPMDLDRYREVMSRADQVYKDYDERHEAVEKQWRDRYPYLTSIEFWSEYLKER